MLKDFVKAWNQGSNPELYELENAAMDPAGLLWDALHAAAPWTDKVVLDLGCGTGFWLPRYALSAATVIGVEPDVDLLDRARSRTSSATVLHGSAEHIPLEDSSVDVVHARFAYFFPTPSNDCTAGLAEVMRVLRPGGALVVIDNDQERGDFADLLAMSSASETQGEGGYVGRWWQSRGADTVPVMSSWEFGGPEELRAVVSMEFRNGTAKSWLDAAPKRNRLSYGYLLHIVTKQNQLHRIG